MSNDIWLNIREVSGLLEISIVAVHKNRKNGKYVTRQVNGNGGKQYRILLQSLGPIAVSKYSKFIIEKAIKEQYKIVSLSLEEMRKYSKVAGESLIKIAELKRAIKEQFE